LSHSFAKILPFNAFSEGDLPGRWYLFFAVTSHPLDYSDLSSLLKYIRVKNSGGLKLDYKCFVLGLPRVTADLQFAFVEMGVTCRDGIPEGDSEIAVKPWSISFMPADIDFWILLQPNSFYRMNVDCDRTELVNAVSGLNDLQDIYGRIPHMVSVGPLAHELKRLLEVRPAGDADKVPLIDLLVLFDRRVDLVSPLLGEHSFEAGLWDCQPFHFGRVQFEDEAEDMKVNPLTEADEVYRTTRMWCVSKFNEMSKAEDESEVVRTDCVSELRKESWGRLRSHRVVFESLLCRETESMTRSTQAILSGNRNSSAHAVAMNHALIYNDWVTALRLLGLHSVCGNALSEPELVSIENELRAEFESVNPVEIDRDLATGFDIPGAIENMKKSGLLMTKKVESLFTVIQERRFSAGNCPERQSLTEDNGPLQGFVRPSVFLTHKIVTGDGEWIQEFNRKVKVFEVPQGQSMQRIEGNAAKRTGTVMVFFVGGVTVTEVNLFRQLGRRKVCGNWDIVIGSTDIIRPGQFLKQFSWRLATGPAKIKPRN
jgi:hypothetical protein